MKPGWYWFRSKLSTEAAEKAGEDPRIYNRVGQIYQGTKGLGVLVCGFNYMSLEKALTTFYILEEVKPCSI